MSESRITRITRRTRKGFLDHYMTLIGYKVAQSGRMCYGEVLHFWLQSSIIWKNVLQLAQSNRMSIVGEGIECLVIKTLLTQH